MAVGVVVEPGLRAAIRSAAIDFYFNSWRLAPANLAWAGLLVVVLLAASAWTPALVLLAALGLPVAGLHRMAARITRGEDASFSDFVEGARSLAGPAVAAAAAALVVALVLASNVAIGLAADNPIGWFLAASAAYALLALAMGLLAFWPILADPQRAGEPMRARLRLAGLVILARPGRMLLLTLVVAIVLIAGVVILAGIALVAVAYAALVATRVVLPVADRLEGRGPEAPRPA